MSLLPISQYVSDRTSLSLVAVDNYFLVSAIGVKNGELNDIHEMFSEQYKDGLDAVKVYNKLRLVLSTCDIHKHYTTTTVLKGYAQEALKEG